MPKNEDGEFELILGNRQLLSVFFIVVILLGVFFTMGYIVGRNSAPVTGEMATREPAPIRSTAAAAEPVRTATPESKPAEPVKEETKAAEPPAKSETKPEPKPESKPEPKAQPGALPAYDPVPGQTYLQLAAVGKPEAETLVEVLGKKGFKAIHAAVKEKPGFFRVLVGPLKDAGDVAETRNKLNDAGLQGTQAIKRVF
jgi:DedD protein